MGYAHSKVFINDPSSYATPQSSESSKVDWRSFDYIIVGGGTAGCVLASRLSEDPSMTVLLIEAGETYKNKLFSRIPLGFPRMFNGPYDWKYQTDPEGELGGRRLSWPRGKILGGSSSINAMLYHECDPSDFDSWEKRGATGWGYEALRRYFKKAEKYTPHQSHPVDRSAHGIDGPWVTTHVPIAPISSKIVEAASNLGIPVSSDFNSPEGSLGAGYFTASIDERHERTSAATAYLNDEVLRRPNLTVATSTTTEKVLFSTDERGAPTAIGVQISTSRTGPRFVVGARKEVILSAGAVVSPQLLLLSGIGPSAHLSSLNVPVVHELPAVGQNLLDHFSAGAMLFRAKPGLTWDQVAYNPLKGLVALLRWITLGTGPMSSLATQVGIFVRSDDARLPFGPSGSLPVSDLSSGPHAPDIEFAFAPFTVVDSGARNPPSGTYGITAGSVLLKPSSKGSVELSSACIYDHPIIKANYLSTESDWNMMIKATRLLLQLARTSPLSSSLDLRISESPSDDLFWPADADPDKLSDEEIRTFIRSYGQSAWHPTSSARMGSTPGNSVVDLELRVHGVQGLRVVDASVFPDQVSGHPCAVVVAIAEKAADLVKASE